MIKSSKSHMKQVKPLDLSAVVDLKKKCSNITKRLEAQRNFMIERKQVSIQSDDGSKTETGFKIEGNL